MLFSVFAVSRLPKWSSLFNRGQWQATCISQDAQTWTSIPLVLVDIPLTAEQCVAVQSDEFVRVRYRADVKEKKGQQKQLHSEFSTHKLRSAVPDCVSLSISVFSWSYPPRPTNDSSISSDSVVRNVPQGCFILLCANLFFAHLLSFQLPLESTSKMEIEVHRQ